MIYSISDLHFGHRNVIKMDGRPFETIEEMDATPIRLWNKRVADEVYEFMSRYDKALNAGCMLNGYRPVTLDELIENNLRSRQKETEETIDAEETAKL